jgi:hypothetical protein
MMKNYCSLCGTEIKGNITDYHDLPRIEEERRTIQGETIKVMLWINVKITAGFLCCDCKQMYTEKFVKCLAETRKAAH